MKKEAVIQLVMTLAVCTFSGLFALHFSRKATQREY